MCLIVNSLKKIAETDLVMYKVLTKEDKNFLWYHITRYYTPYRGYRIRFKKGKCHISTHKKSLSVTIHNYYGSDMTTYIIEEGIHAYRELFAAHLTSSQDKVHYAVIPKGAEYYLGDNYDIVSTDMIIFETEKDYYKYKQEHDVTFFY